MNDFMIRVPDAYAEIRGTTKYPKINGKVCFYSVHGGTVIAAEIYGLPENGPQMIGNFFGFHIHEGNVCSGDASDLLKNTGGHYNPLNTKHPDHAGDLVPLLSVGEKAWSLFYTGRFYPEDVVGKTVVIHDMPDDFRSQPAGDSGEKIACGVILEPDMREEDN
ncbi:MAG: superoxide dismutase family protein [Schaedlerella sp.]|nr:superoxide dismutase family protein [Schaedlerella sp.]